MASWRFQRRRKLLPGVTLNLSKRGAESPKVLAQAAALSENQIFKIVRAAREGR